MSHKLVNQIKPMIGLGLVAKSVLIQLADSSMDGESISFRMEQLCIWVNCSRRAAQHALHKLEDQKLIIPQLPAPKGPGCRHTYRFNLLVEEVPAPSPPTNGHVKPPQKADVVVPPSEPEPPKTPLTPEQIAARHAMLQEQLARLAEKKRMVALERKGRREREQTTNL